MYMNFHGRVRVFLIGLLLCLAGLGAGFDQAGAQSEEVIFDNGNVYGVINGPVAFPRFCIDQEYTVTSIHHYHWNGGRGSTPGQIYLDRRDESGFYVEIGSWNAAATAGWGSPTLDPSKTMYWGVFPNMVLQPGCYQTRDSDTATWSTNAQADYDGMCIVKGVIGGGGGGGGGGDSSAEIGPEGGSVEVDGAALTVPAGAVSGTAGFSISADGSAPTGWEDYAAGQAYTIGYEAQAIKGDLEIAIDIPADALGQEIMIAVAGLGAGRYSGAGEYNSVDLYDATISNGRASVNLSFDLNTAAATADRGRAAAQADRETGGLKAWLVRRWRQEFSPGGSSFAGSRIRLCYPSDLDGDKTTVIDPILALGDQAIDKMWNIGLTVVASIGRKYEEIDNWALPVNVSLSVPAGRYAEQDTPVWGKDQQYVNLNYQYCTAANLTKLKSLLGHEMFHCVQDRYDPRSAYSQASQVYPLLWLKEASSTWFEFEMSAAPKQYLPDDLSAFYIASGFGLDPDQVGTEQDKDGSQISKATAITRTGYWASIWLRFMTDKSQYGSALISRTWNAVQAMTGAYRGLTALFTALGGEDVAKTEFVDFAGKWLFGKHDYGKLEIPDNTEQWTAGASHTFTVKMRPYSCVKYYLAFPSSTQGKTYKISVSPTGAADLTAQLWTKAASVGGALTYVQDLTEFGFTSQGVHHYYVALIYTGGLGQNQTATVTVTEENSSNPPGETSWSKSWSDVTFDNYGGRVSGNVSLEVSVSGEGAVLSEPSVPASDYGVGVRFTIPRPAAGKTHTYTVTGAVGGLTHPTYSFANQSQYFRDGSTGSNAGRSATFTITNDSYGKSYDYYIGADVIGSSGSKIGYWGEEVMRVSFTVDR